MDVGDAKVGDIVIVMITGMLGRYEGTVIEMDRYGYPIIKVEEEGPFSRLKMGDYVLLERRNALP